MASQCFILVQGEKDGKLMVLEYQNKINSDNKMDDTYLFNERYKHDVTNFSPSKDITDNFKMGKYNVVFTFDKIIRDYEKCCGENKSIVLQQIKNDLSMSLTLNPFDYEGFSDFKKLVDVKLEEYQTNHASGKSVTYLKELTQLHDLLMNAQKEYKVLRVVFGWNS